MWRGFSFSSTASNTNCALRTLRRMLHKAEEWNLLGKVPKFKLLREHGRRLRLDDDAEQRLLVAASACSWKSSSFELFRDVIILARDTRMRNQRELYCMRTENLDWNNRIIFVPDSKTADGRRMIPMSDRVYELLRVRAEGKGEGWLFPSNRSKCGHLTYLAKQFRAARAKAGLAKDLVPVLQPARLRHASTERHRKPRGRNEDDGPQGCENCDAVPTSRT
jgi:integrase